MTNNLNLTAVAILAGCATVPTRTVCPGGMDLCYSEIIPQSELISPVRGSIQPAAQPAAGPLSGGSHTPPLWPPTPPVVSIIEYPLPVDNIICNDGTPSPTCTTCSAGCCSHHGGCL